jgi:hypothetical protein
MVSKRKGTDLMQHHDSEGTVLESLATLLHQQIQLENGKRRVMMFPCDEKGQWKERLPLPKGMRSYATPYGMFHYNPDSIGESEIECHLQWDSLNTILLLGPYSKRFIQSLVDDGAIPLAIVERTPMGVEVRAAYSCNSVAQEVFEYFSRTRDPGNTISIEPCETTLFRRFHAP